MEYETIIDTDDLQKFLDYSNSWFLAWYKDIESFYVVSRKCTFDENNKKKVRPIYLHRFLTDAEINTYVDHKNHNTLDNRKENLRITLNSTNNKNRKGKNSNNKSGYRNVSWNKSGNYWMVQLQIEGKNKILKTFPKEQLEEAGIYAELMRNEIYGEYAGLN